MKLSILHVGRCGLRFNKVRVPYLRYYIFCCHFFVFFCCCFCALRLNISVDCLAMHILGTFLF